MELHFACVCRYFGSKVDRSVAEDLAHDTFVSCLESLERFEGRGCLRAFVLGIARHRLHKHLRSREREGRALAKHEHSIQDLLSTRSDAIEIRSEHELLSRSLGTLPPELRILVELYYWDELPLTDIAEIVGLPLGTVKTRLARARARLKEAVRDGVRPQS